MTAPAVWPVAAFDFDLPLARIAQRPVTPRDAARLLTVGDRLKDRTVHDLPDLLRPGDLLVFNDTKVIPARLFGHRRGSKVEVTLHRREGGNLWRAFAKPAKKLALGDTVVFGDDLSAEVAAKGEAGEVTLAFDRADAQLMAALERRGRLPLPPYIKRPDGADARDRDDYQTLFARAEGAVAAPTAGLHFTPRLMDALAARGIGRATVTLHVGAGTFLPMKGDTLAEHRMHAEWGTVTAETAAALNRGRDHGGRIVAVGTTSLRLLESAAGNDGVIRPFAGTTDLFIMPGHRFKTADLLMTNFHLPRSTLFVLVAAFAGLERMQAAYAHAVAAGYRFYSYGDACLLERAQP